MEDGRAADAAGQAADAGVQNQNATPKTYSEEELKKVIAERDKAKERLRLIDEAAKKAEEDQKIAEGKARELLAEKEARLTELEAKAKAYEEQQRKLRESLLGKLTDEADKIAGESITDLDKLSRYVELRSQKQDGGPFDGKGQSKAGKLDINTLGKNFGEIEAELRRRKLAI